MLRNLSALFGYEVTSQQRPDEQIGKIDDAYFDDETWTLRYLIVDTGGWFSTNRVLLAPEAFVEADWTKGSVAVALTREQIEGAPAIDTQKPVARQHEIDLRRYYGWTPYWGIGMTPFGAIYPTSRQLELTDQEEREQRRTHQLADQPYDKDEGDPHLRSAREVNGYRIGAQGGEIGHVEDFIVETEGWEFRYLVVDTRNWLPGKKVLLAPAWVAEIDYPMHTVRVDLARDRIKDAPEFDPSAPVNRAYEERLYDYYARPAYWRDEPRRRAV